MVEEDRVLMSEKELRRVHVIHQVLERTLTQVQAGELLGVTSRQSRRLLRRVEQEGDQGLVHRGRGKSSNRRIPEKKKAKALQLYMQRYGDFGPTLAAEEFVERQGLSVSDETLRTWLLAEGVDHFDGGNVRIGLGGRGRRTGGNWSSSMDRTTIGWKGVARHVS